MLRSIGAHPREDLLLVDDLPHVRILEGRDIGNVGVVTAVAARHISGTLCVKQKERTKTVPHKSAQYAISVWLCPLLHLIARV